jgi:hypothetical protein
MKCNKAAAAGFTAHSFASKKALGKKPVDILSVEASAEGTRSFSIIASCTKKPGLYAEPWADSDYCVLTGILFCGIVIANSVEVIATEHQFVARFFSDLGERLSRLMAPATQNNW